jgi:hypothetical protein
VEVPPPIRAPSNGPVVIVEDVLRIGDDLDVPDAQVVAPLQNPFVGKHARAEFHAVVVGLEVAGIVDQLVRKIPIEGVLDPRSETSGSARVLPAGAVDINLERAQIERHKALALKQKGAAV